jgi:hypothetical protein
LGETVTITIKEFQLTDRADWKWHGKVIRYGADGSVMVVKEGSGTVQLGSDEIWTTDLTAPSTFPVKTFYWHGTVPYVKYVAQVTLQNPKKLIGIGMAKTFILVNKRQDIIDFMNNTMLTKVDELITATNDELTTKIDARINECRSGNRTDEDVATRWEAIKSDIESSKADLENIKTLINTAINDLTIRNAKIADDEINNFWVKHGATRDEFRTLLTLTQEKCLEAAGGG